VFGENPALTRTPRHSEEIAMIQEKKLPGPEAPEPEIQEGHNRSKARDDQLKRIIKRHPKRDEPRVDSVDEMDLPPP
jgi:hypothetical protein